VRFEPHQDRQVLSRSLAIGDLHLSVLQPAFEGLVHPSKLYGIMAAGRPTVFVGDTAGETAAILSRHDCGISVRSGDSAGLATAILSLSQNQQERIRLGENARRAFDHNYSMAIAIHKWEMLIASLTSTKTA
jgi:colanic acid biosynthesis glycosyl transferase WcaI